MEEALAAGFSKKKIPDARERLKVASTKKRIKGGWSPKG